MDTDRMPELIVEYKVRKVGDERPWGSIGVFYTQSFFSYNTDWQWKLAKDFAIKLLIDNEGAINVAYCEQGKDIGFSVLRETEFDLWKDIGFSVLRETEFDL